MSRKEYSRNHRKQARKEMISLLGGKCGCGFSDWRALQIDHINGGGNKDRAKNGNSYTKLRNEVREDVKNNGNKYQLLCSNCNWIKRYENNELR